MKEGGGGGEEGRDTEIRLVSGLAHRVHTEWQLPTFGLAGGGGGVRPPPFSLVTLKYKVAVYAPAERADALSLHC